MALSFASATVGPAGNLLMSHNIQSCKHTSTGVYLLTYAPGFAASSGGPQATPVGNKLFAAVNLVAASHCEVLVTDLKGNRTDGNFTFLVVGSA